MPINSECGCSWEMGPCEGHAEVLVQREGAHSRTGDELIMCFIDDAMSLGAELSAFGRAIYDDACVALGESRWIEDDDLAEALQDLAGQVECGEMPDDSFVVWDDGFIVYKLIGGPLLDES